MTDRDLWLSLCGGGTCRLPEPSSIRWAGRATVARPRPCQPRPAHLSGSRQPLSPSLFLQRGAEVTLLLLSGPKWCPRAALGLHLHARMCVGPLCLPASPGSKVPCAWRMAGVHEAPAAEQTSRGGWHSLCKLKVLHKHKSTHSPACVSICPHYKATLIHSTVATLEAPGCPCPFRTGPAHSSHVVAVEE